MNMRKQSKWILIGLLFLFSVVGMFLAYILNTTWPEENLHLSASDMKLTSPFSTSLCESLDLTSDHPFLAHHVRGQAKINPSVLTRNTMDFSLQLKKFQRIQLHYYLLPESVVNLVVCASSPGSSVHILKGQSKFNNRVKRHVSPHLRENDYESYEEDSEEKDSVEYYTDDDRAATVSTSKTDRFKNCRHVLKSQDIPSTYINDALMCQFTAMTRPIQFNITEADTYEILFVNNFIQDNHLNIRLVIDRTTYYMDRDISNFHICLASITCTVSLPFCSKDRVIVWIPSEPKAGLTTHTVQARCRPRFTLFATLIVVAPLLIFTLVALIMKIGLHLSSGYSALDQSLGNERCIATRSLATNNAGEKDIDEHHTVTSFCLLELKDPEDCGSAERDSDSNQEDHCHLKTNLELPTYEALCEEHPPPYINFGTSSGKPFKE